MDVFKIGFAVQTKTARTKAKPMWSLIGCLLAFALTTFRPAFANEPLTAEAANLPDYFVSECTRNFPAVTTDVAFIDLPIVENHNKSFKTITESARELKSAHADETYVLGLTKFETTWRINVSLASLSPEGSNIHCTRPKISIELGFNYHIVEIAEELERQTCEYQFVRNHEYEHVYINRSNLEKYRRELADAFNYRFTTQILYGSLDNIKRDIEKRKDTEWLPFIKETTAALEAQGNQRHKLIDTPEEYAKGNSVCEGKIPEIIRASLNNQ